MTKPFHRKLIHTASALGLSALLLPVASFADDWNLRVLGQWVTTSENDFGQLEEGAGVYLGLERRLSQRWGVELGLGWNQLEGTVSQSFDSELIDVESRFDSEIEWLPLSLAGNFHLTPEANFDLYVAGRLGWAFFDDFRASAYQAIDFGPPTGLVTSQGTFDLAADDAFFYGIRLGFDHPFGTSGWAVSATADWTRMELELHRDLGPTQPDLDDPLPGPSAPALLDLDPVTVGVGVSKRW